MENEVKLTKLASCAGCGAVMGAFLVDPTDIAVLLSLT